MRWLITGADGFVAGHLIRRVLDDGEQNRICGLAFNRGSAPNLPEDPRIALRLGDVLDSRDVAEAFAAARPDAVLHLAAQTSVSRSWSDPGATYRTNVLGQLHVLEAAREQAEIPRVVIASSSEVYGPAEATGSPIPEDAPLDPRSPYAVTKAAQDLQAMQYFRALGLPTIRLRLFNHTGPGRPPIFAASSFASQIAAIEAGRQAPEIRVGALDVRRDFTDVRDVARAWVLAAQRGRPGAAYNICSGRSVAIGEIVDHLLGRAAGPIRVVPDPARVRAAEIPELFGDPARAAEELGWSATIALERTLDDLLAWWREITPAA